MNNIIFLDVDGTLVDVPRGLAEPTEKTKYAIKELINNGDSVFIASGRFKANVHKSIKDLKPSGYILSNGGYIEYDGKVLYSKTFDVNAFNKLNDFSLKYDCLLSCETQEYLYTPIINDKFRDFLKRWKLEYLDVKDHYEGMPFYKCCMYFDDYKTVSIFEKEFDGVVDYRAQTADPKGLSYDINIIGVNKGNAVDETINRLNINIDNTYCFCDGTNDIELAKACRYSYALANGDNDLKKIAYGIADDVINDGVYNKLVEIGLIKKMG